MYLYGSGDEEHKSNRDHRRYELPDSSGDGEIKRDCDEYEVKEKNVQETARSCPAVLSHCEI